MTPRRLGSVVAVLAALLSAPTSVAPAAYAGPGSLSRGEDAHLTWLQRLPEPRGAALLHHARGDEARLGVPRNPAYRLTLVGATYLGWVVAQERQTGTRLFAVQGRRVEEVLRVAWRETPDQFLTGGNTRIVRWSADSAGVTLKLYDARGTRLLTHTYPGETGQLLRYDGAGVRFALSDRTCLWHTAEDTITCVDGAAATVRPKPDVAMMRTADGSYGPTSLDDPGTPAWTADVAPRAISPAGTWVAVVAHTATTASEDLQVRRVADGEIVRTRALTHQTGDEVWWEDDSHLVYTTGVDGKGYVLVRCDVTTGHCERASGYVREYAFSVLATVRHY